MMSQEAIRDDPALGLVDLADDSPEPRELRVEGRLPEWLGGSLLRNGPARWSVGSDRLRHWFDGQAMIHHFSFEGGRVHYANRMLDTAARREAEEHGGLRRREFATDPCRSIFQRVHALFASGDTFTDNANVSVQRLGDRLIAMTETPMPLTFDPKTLAVLGEAYRAPGQLTTAHPHRDRKDGGLLNLATHVGPRSSYRLFRMGVQSAEPEMVAEASVSEPAYMHSFGITENHFVLAEFPLVVSPIRLGTSKRPFIENFEWKPERGTRFTVLDRGDGTVRARLQGPPCFAFHHINAFERGGSLLVDMCASEDARIIEELYLDRIHGRLRGDQPGFASPPRPERFRLDLDRGEVERSRLSKEMLELPVIDFARVRERPYRKVWGVGSDGAWLDRVVALDVERGEHTEWREPGSYPGEPVFVRRPDGEGEGDGILLTVVLSGETSSLVALDAGSLETLARADVGHHIPYGFHGLHTVL